MIFLFDKFKKLKGTVRNRHTISLLYERERNGLYTVSAEIPLKITDKKTVYNYHKKVKDSDFLGHYDREGRFQLHKIASVDIEDSSIFIKGVHLFFDEAKAGAIIQERRFRDSEIVDGARVAFDTIGWSVVDVDVSDTADYIFYNVSPLEARAILVETFDYEFDYWLDFDGKNIRNKQISIKREMGKDSNKRYNYGHNVLNIKVEQDYSEIYTAVIGRGKGEDLGDDAYGRRIEYTDVEWKTPTHPMNKPKGSRVLHDENATQLFGYHEDGKVSPRTKVEIFEDIEEPAKLLRASYNWLRENSVPKAVFSLKVPDGDGLDLGDKVHVIYRDIDLVKHTRVTRVIDDLVSGNRDVEFGDTAYFKTDRRLSGVKSELKRVGGSMSSRISRLKAEFDRRFDNEVKQWKDDFEQALIDAEAAVEAMRVTMTEEFEAAQKAFEVEFNQSVSDAKKHADAVADAKASQVQGNLDSFAGRHEQLVGELQGNIVNINGEIADARADVSGILGRLTGVDGSISGIKGSLTEIEGTLTNTKTQLESQITDARTELEKSISDARAELERFDVGGRNYIKDSKVIPMTSADSGARDNTEHISTDDYIEIKSNKDFQSYWYRYYAINTDNRISDESIFVYDSDYQTFGIDILTESDNFEMYINQRHTDHTNSYSSDTISLPNTNGKWQRIYITLPLKHDGLQRSVFYVFISGGKASNPNSFLTNDYIRLKESKLEKGNKGTDWTPAPEDTEQKITNINQSITNIEGELSSKVEQTEVDALSGTVERQGTLLTQTSEEVSSKADKSVVDTLTGRVANTESSVTQNAKEIALKASQSDLNSVTGRVSSAESQLSVQAGQIELRATKKELEGVDGRVSATEASLTVMDDEISSVVGRVSDNETNISSVVQDVNSITSTVASLEGDVATQGSKIEQTEDAISSKVWMDDVANIGANLLPTSPNAWEDGSYWSTGNANNTLKENIRLKKDLAVPTYRDVEYTFTCNSREQSNVRAWMLVNYDTANPGTSTTLSIPRGQSRTIRTTGNRIVLTAYPVSGESVSVSGFEHNPTSNIKVKLEQGGSATPLLNVLSHIEQKADEVSIKVSELGSIDGESLLTQSDISVRADRILLGSQEIGAETLSSIISVSPRSIDIITNKLNLTGNLNVKGQIESISTSAVKADFANIFAGTADIQFIVAKHLASDAIQARHLLVTNAMAEKIIANSVMAREVKALSIDAVEANIGSIRSKILTSNVILSSHINSSNALIDKIFSSTAMFERMMAKSGFVRTLNTVTIDTDQITIRRPDGGRLISNGVLENTFSIQFIQPRFEGVGVDWSANYFRTTNTSYTTAAAFSYLRGGRYLTVEGYCEMRSAVSGAADTTLGHIRLLEYSSGSRSSYTTIESRGTNKGRNQFFRIRIDMGVPQYEQRNFYVQFRTLHSGNAAHFRINQAYYHG